MKSVLSIAGSDSSGGAGIQADIKTISAHHLFASTVVTAITAQNTCGVTAASGVDGELVRGQIDAVFSDIRPDAVKIGMVSSPELVGKIAEGLRRHAASNIVLDPVMVATSGSVLAEGGAIDRSVRELFPLATVVTPNIPEAEALSGIQIRNEADMESAARKIMTSGCGAVLVKGGHGSSATASDFLLDADGAGVWISSERIDNPNTHGTGCTLSSAIACGLAQGEPLSQAIKNAKEYLVGALRAQLDLGRGTGPLDHMWVLDR